MSQSSEPTTAPTSATQPIINIRDDANANNISWLVNDGLPDESSPSSTEPQEREEPQEDLVEDEEPERDEGDENQSSDEVDEDEEEKPKKKRNRVPLDRRIADLTRKVKHYQSVTHDVFSQKENLEKEKLALADELFKAKKKLLEAHRETINTNLIQANEEGDSTRSAKATDLLTQYTAELWRLEDEQNRFKQNYSATPQPRQFEPEPADDYNENAEHGQEWMKSNPWANPNSRHFDQDMYQDANDYSVELARQYKSEGRADEIETPDFWQDISEYVKDTYGANARSSQQPKERMKMKPSKSNVAPVTKPSSPSESPKRKQEIVLTQAQKEIAHSMRGSIKDANGKFITDPKTLEEYYKRNVR